jgi:hypothetical protein
MPKRDGPIVGAAEGPYKDRWVAAQLIGPNVEPEPRHAILKRETETVTAGPSHSPELSVIQQKPCHQPEA